MLNIVFAIFSLALLLLFIKENNENKRNDYCFSYVITMLATAVIEIFTLIFKR